MWVVLPYIYNVFIYIYIDFASLLPYEEKTEI